MTAQMDLRFLRQHPLKLEDETVSDATAEKRIERTAEKAAEKSTKTEQRYDKVHSIFSK